MAELVTTQATLRPDQLESMLKKMDRLGLAYFFSVCTGPAFKLLCEADGQDYNGLTLYLCDDGTWTALVDVVVGTKE